MPRSRSVVIVSPGKVPFTWTDLRERRTSRPHLDDNGLADRVARRRVSTRRTERHVDPSSCGSRLPSTDGTPLCAARGEELADGALHCLLECCQLTDGKRTDRRAGKADSA